MPSAVFETIYQLKWFQYPVYWNEITEVVASPMELVQRVKALYATFESREGEGVVYSVQNALGDKLYIGCSDEGWVVMSETAAGAEAISDSDPQRKGHKSFLFPEWTDIERRHLISPELAADVIRWWAETGLLSDKVPWSR